MKASNWLYVRPRHTRPNDRVYKLGTISASWNGIELQSKKGYYMEIELTDDEIIQLQQELVNIQNAKKKGL